MKAVLIFLLTTTVWAQEPTFKTRTREVIVPVSVLMKSGKPVENVTASDFQVLNDGQPQRVQMILRDASPLPIDAVIVLQLDEGSAPALAKIKKTASLISGYITNDMGIEQPSQAAVVTAADEVNLVQKFTADPDILGDTFAKLSAKGASARLIDAVNLACDLLATTDPRARRIIVLLSESRDLGSATRFSDVVVKAQSENVTIFTVSYSAFVTAFTQKASDRPPPPDLPGLYDPSNHGGVNLLAIPALLAQWGKTNVAEAFAQTTGGFHQKFTTLRSLETQLTTIGMDIHNRYVLSFAPPASQPPGYHQLSVTLRSPGDRRVHARAGYWTTPE